MRIGVATVDAPPRYQSAAWRAPAVAVFTSMAAFLVHGSGWVWWSLFLLPVLGIAASSARLLTGPRPETPATAGTVAPG
jgi:hypothetical protein